MWSFGEYKKTKPRTMRIKLHFQNLVCDKKTFNNSKTYKTTSL